MAAPYITGVTTLRLIHPDRSFELFWHSAGSPDKWFIAGQDYPETSSFFGDQQLVDLSGILAEWTLRHRCVSVPATSVLFLPLCTTTLN
jgi:hypothetical protein